MVVRDEADRYLDAMLSWTKLLVDQIHVFDDHSTDDTVERALAHGAQVSIRAEGEPPFMADEAGCREAGWRAMEAAVHPEEGDWVLCLDADEFLFGGGNEGERSALLELADVAQAEGYHCDGLEFAVGEVFAVEE